MRTPPARVACAPGPGRLGTVAAMRLATWNVNSIRTRIDRVADVLTRHEIDVLAMQELKCKPEQFPRERFEELGYEVAVVGYNQWNGVGIASRVGLENVEVGFVDMPGFHKDPEAEQAAEARALAATCGGVRIASLYVPNGRELEDPHYAYKLRWLEALRAQVASSLAADPALQLAVVGDFNIAPLDTDVWSMEFFAGKTHVSQPERDAFQALLDAGLTDVVRPHEPTQYTYWDYQQLRFPKNEGMRIDFVLASDALAQRVTGAHHDRNERKGKGASDHVPVIVDLAG